MWRGEAKTYDLRGRKVSVVMAGNPYTESGDKFQIPDMLANRADVYNLGDVSGRHREAFELSFIENSLTSNGTLSRLAAHPHDVIGVAGLAADKDPSSVDLEGNYAADELSAMVAVMRKLLRVRDVILSVNAEYIRSAAQADEFRTEPPFKLQGSYRNMNRIAERVLPVMNDAELDELIRTSYRNDAQTLTTGAEANLLKFRELVGWLSDEDRQRWEVIKQTYRRNQKLRGLDEGDRFGQAIAQLALFADGLSDLRGTLSDGIERLANRTETVPTIDPAQTAIADRLEELRGAFGAMVKAVEINRLQPALAASKPNEPSKLTIDPEIVHQFAELLRANAPSHVRIVDGDGQTSAGPPAAITVVNKIPPALLNLLRDQFRLMEAWLRPVLSASERQSDEMSDLAAQIKTCLADYERLVGRIEATRGEGR